jgi:hypothetical protein
MRIEQDPGWRQLGFYYSFLFFHTLPEHGPLVNIRIPNLNHPRTIMSWLKRRPEVFNLMGIVAVSYCKPYVI